eukprot:SAG31_NODE_3123_length_4651_cov_2.784490_1_plen_401_part_00
MLSRSGGRQSLRWRLSYFCSIAVVRNHFFVAAEDAALAGTADYMEVWPVDMSQQLNYIVQDTKHPHIVIEPPSAGVHVAYSWRGYSKGRHEQPPRPSLTVSGFGAGIKEGLHFHLHGLEAEQCAALSSWSKAEREHATRALQRRLCAALMHAIGAIALPGLDENCTVLSQLADAGPTILFDQDGFLAQRADRLPLYDASDSTELKAADGPKRCDRMLRLLVPPEHAAAPPVSFFDPTRVRSRTHAPGDNSVGYVQQVLDNEKTGRRNFWVDTLDASSRWLSQQWHLTLRLQPLGAASCVDSIPCKNDKNWMSVEMGTCRDYRGDMTPYGPEDCSLVAQHMSHDQRLPSTACPASCRTCCPGLFDFTEKVCSNHFASLFVFHPIPPHLFVCCCFSQSFGPT